LKLVLIGERPDHGDAVTVSEETLEKPPDAVLLLDGIRESLLILEGLLQVLLRGDLFALSIDELQSEITNNPKECWEIFSIFFRINVVLLQS